MKVPPKRTILIVINFFSEPRERTTLSNEPLYVPSTEIGPPPQCWEVIYAPAMFKQLKHNSLMFRQNYISHV